MAVAVTLLEDHKGMTSPKVSGDEYYVDALIDMGTYASGGLSVTAASLGLDRVTQVMVTGQDSVIAYVVPEVSATPLLYPTAVLKWSAALPEVETFND